MSKSPEDKALEKAKIQLMHIPNTVFYTTILFSLKQSWTDKIPTAATDGTRLLINPTFFLDLSEEERIGLIVHEVLHVALNHMSRKGDRHPEVWNMAADYVINASVIEADYKLPEGGLYDPKYDNMSSEQVYKILWDELEKEAAAGGAEAAGVMIPGGGDLQYPSDVIEQEVTEKAVADIVQRAKLTAEVSNSNPGTMPGELERSLDSVLNPKLPWDVMLHNYFTNFAKDDYTWSRPNRRYAPTHYLPTAYSEAVCDVATAVDSSGSVEDEQFAYFIREHAALKHMLNPQKMTIIDFDSEIQCIHEVSEGTDILSELKFTGGGGTYIVPVLEWAIKNKPEVLIIFTDGEFHMPPEDYWPTCPVLWLIHDNPHFTAPFGDVIHYEIG